jgi:hypothetical protein
MGRMRFLQMRWIVPILLLVVIYAADQIRIGRPDHKYRLTVDVETPSGTRSASGIMSVRPNRSYGGTGSGSSLPQTKGDALLVDLGDGKNLVVLLAYGADGSNFDDPSFLPTRMLGARDRRVGFRDVKTFAGAAPLPVPEQLRPVVVSFTDINDPKSAQRASVSDLEASLGKGYRLLGFSLDVVANGFWPFDFGGVLGEPVTRGIEAKLPWLKTPGAATAALQAAGLKAGEEFAAEAAFTRK